MILSCPSCGTRYLVDAHAIGASGRRVRCARCRNEWVQQPPQDLPKRIDPPASPPSHADPAPFEVPFGAGHDTRTDTGARNTGHLLPALIRPATEPWWAWAGLAAVVAALIAAGWWWRDDAVAAWPPIAKLYAMVGVPVQSTALAFTDQRLDVLGDGATRSLVVSGAVANHGTADEIVPRIRIAVLDAAGRELSAWRVAPPVPVLAPGATAPFRAPLPAQPDDAATVRVAFETPAEASEPGPPMLEGTATAPRLPPPAPVPAPAQAAPPQPSPEPPPEPASPAAAGPPAPSGAPAPPADATLPAPPR